MKLKNSQSPKSALSLEAKIAAFEQKNPDIANALKIFDMTIADYETTLKSIDTTKITVTSSTKVE